MSTAVKPDGYMCPPLGSYKTIMAHKMPLCGGIHRISSADRKASAIAQEIAKRCSSSSHMIEIMGSVAQIP